MKAFLDALFNWFKRWITALLFAFLVFAFGYYIRYGVEVWLQVALAILVGVYAIRDLWSKARAKEKARAKSLKWESMPLGRDRDMVRLVWEGYTNEEIAKRVKLEHGRSVANLLTTIRADYPDVLPSGDERRNLQNEG